jgi:glycosyltransferase involved in cell wall biosynthesis
MANIAVVILTYNEALHIERLLRQLKGLAREIIVVDSYSTDSTVEIAEAYGATVLRNKFVNQAKQFQWGLDNAQITSEWVMRVDADEEIGADLAAEISTKLPNLPNDVVGINLKRKHIFLGRWIKHGGRFPLLLLRIWRLGKGRVEDRWMDEHVIVWGGRTVTFDGEFSDHNLNSIGHLIDKHNKYATREALDVLNRKYGGVTDDQLMSTKSTSRQAATKRFIKSRLYNRIPFWVAAPGYFLYRYLIQLGFLDGVEGLIYHSLQGGWYRFLVGAKIYEYERILEKINSMDKKRKTLFRLAESDLNR